MTASAVSAIGQTVDVSTWPTSYGPTLLVQHARLLAESGISVEVAQTRRYRSVEVKAELERLGFGRNQRQTPTLVSPVYNTTGGFAMFQHRPDEPRIRDGKPVKYETPVKASMVLDVPPGVRPALKDPRIPLFVTEGVRKADSAVSRGICCISVLGVWNWRGTNEVGGKTALADWEYVALNRRLVYLAFDNDVTRKREVYDALRRFKAFLEHRGAEVRVIYLPSGPDGTKVGLDDPPARDYTADELVALSCADLEPPPAGGREAASTYRDTADGLIWLKPTRDGDVPTPLTNFTARIAADVAEDDGAELRRYFEIEATIRGRTSRFAVPSAQFVSMNWPVEQLGAGAIVYPGLGQRDHARAAIQFLSGDAPERTVYAHIGWRRLADTWAYLHAGGAIGPVGPVSTIEVSLAEPLTRYTLPVPPAGDELVRCVRASLRVLTVAPDRLTIPGLAAVYRAVLGGTDFSMHYAGPTGVGKSELAALLQQHFGATFDARHLPGSWSSTANALEGLAFTCKDAVLVIDDFCPGGAQSDVQRLHRDADRLLRAQGNVSGRQRMRSDASLRPTKPPRGLIVSTGEDIPRGQSLRARVFVQDLSPGDVDWAVLGACQQDAWTGLYAAAMAGFVQWLALRYEDIRGRLKGDVVELRQQAVQAPAHRRTPEIVANLAVGFGMFLQFAQDVGAVDAREVQHLWMRAWEALGESAAAQEHHQLAAEPTGQFLGLLRSALASGKAHLAAPSGREPDVPEAWGWISVDVGTGENQRSEWRAQGTRVGWIDGDAVYLDMGAAFAAAQAIGVGAGDGLTVSTNTLKKRMHERGLLASTEVRAGWMRLEVRKTLQGARRDVLHLHEATLSPPETGPTVPTGPITALPSSNGSVSGPVLWAGSGSPVGKPAHKTGPIQAAAENGKPVKGTVGTVGPVFQTDKSTAVNTAPVPTGCCPGCRKTLMGREVEWGCCARCRKARS